MVRPMKSPNMISTTGRMPVMAAPTAMPVKPASEIGVSRTRSGPNSSTKPDSTLNAVPASATSSPMTKTRLSRRISSASASRTASPNVNSRVATAASGIDILVHLVYCGVRSRQRELDGLLNLGVHLRLHFIEAGDALLAQETAEEFQRIALGLPTGLFLLGTVVIAAHIADVMAHEAVGVREQERRTLARARAFDELLGGGIDRTHVLPIDAFGFETEAPCARQDVAGGGVIVVRVFVVEVVFADVDHRQFPKRGHVHDLI